MGTVLEQLPEKIQRHIRGMIANTKLPQNEESMEVLAKNWIAKKEAFESMIKSINMTETDTLEIADKRAAILLTYSGSLIGMGPDKGDGRWVEYASIKLRSNVPGIIAVENTGIKETIKIDATASFTQGQIKSTSALFTIAVCATDVDLSEQDTRVREAMIYLTNAFVKLNRKSFAVEGEAPEQFNLKTMVKFLAEKNNMTQKQTKALLLDFFALVETGALLGERVALGRIGNFFLKIRPPRKPRVLKNRFTGREITIPAKPERYAPKINFSKRLKERAALIKPE
jgi:nucleoid DNA-binding protein